MVVLRFFAERWVAMWTVAAARRCPARRVSRETERIDDASSNMNASESLQSASAKDARLREERSQMRDTGGALQTFSGKRKLVKTLLRIRLTKNWAKGPSECISRYNQMCRKRGLQANFEEKVSSLQQERRKAYEDIKFILKAVGNRKGDCA